MADDYRTGWYEGRTDQMCDLVAAGKPVGSLLVAPHLVEALQVICEEKRCRCPVENGVGANEWSVFYVYRRPTMLDVIKHSRRFHDDSALGIWFKGIMYGYGLEEIERFINHNGLAVRSGSRPTST